ncbi:MAG: glycosyltransferase family 39 protein, partial [Pirellulaceae bacterium]|nr:glycosyltransferase family 39 protein [Pirellulaceae bacterium]
WLLLLGGALLLRLAAAAWWEARLPAGERFGFGDSQSYWMLAQTIVRGEPYQYGGPDLRVFRTPGYPLLLAGLLVLVGDDPPAFWARAMGALLGVAAVAGTGCLAWQLFDSRAAWIAAGLTAIYPGAIAMSVLLLSEAPFAPCLMAQLNCWTWAARTERAPARVLAALLAGASAGAATLMWPSWLLFSPLALVLAIAFGRQRARHAWLGLWLLLGLCAVMAPWWVRNYRVVGTFVPTTLQMGASLYDGLSPTADGSSDMRFVDDFYRRQKAEEARLGGPLPGTFEQRLDRRLRDEALRWAQTHPERVAKLAGVKFLRMWNVWPNATDLRSPWLRLAIMAGYVPLLAAALIGFRRFAHRGWPYVLCVLPAAYLTLLHVVFVSSIRYRQPAMLPLAVLAAGWLAGWWKARRGTGLASGEFSVSDSGPGG